MIPLLLLLLGCPTDTAWEGTFDMPTAVAVLPAGGPFDEPVGYAASAHGGRVNLLDLKRGIYLADQGDASFVRAAPLATGADRILASLAVHASGDAVTVFAADKAFGHLLELPHVVELDEAGVPIRPRTRATPPRFVDADLSGDLAVLDDLDVREGFAATEDWTLTFDGEAWQVVGSRSGPQEMPAWFGLPWTAQGGALRFTVRGTGATAGDEIRFTVHSGLREHDLGGTPVALAMAPDQSLLAVSLQGDAPGLVLWDPVARAVAERIALPSDARPYGLAWSPEGTLYAADTGRAAAWEVVPGEAPVELALPWPTLDVAPLGGQLYVAPSGGRSVFLLDLGTRELVDLNPIAPGIDGIDMDTPVTGLEAIPMPWTWPEADASGVPHRGRGVAVSRYDGKVVFMKEGLGCLIEDRFGPRTQANTQFSGALDYQTNFGNVAGGAFLEGNGENDRSVQVNGCAGVARQETWTLTFRRNQAAWEVEGSRSGPQDGLAHEDERYVSDDGSVSFVVRGGTTPSQEGWQITFIILPGYLEANGNTDDDLERELSFDVLQDPKWFAVIPESSTDSPWSPSAEVPFVLVPAAGGDLVGRVDPRNGDIDAWWW